MDRVRPACQLDVPSHPRLRGSALPFEGLLYGPVTTRRTDPALPPAPAVALGPGCPGLPQVGAMPGNGQSLLAENDPVVAPGSAGASLMGGDGIEPPTPCV